MSALVDEAIAAGTAEILQERERLEQVARDLETELKDLDVEQKEIEEACGDALLDARFSGDTKTEKKVAKDLEHIRIKRIMLERQLAACRTRIDDTIIEKWAAEARECRRRAAEYRTAEATHRAVTEDLLKQINEYEDCDYHLEYPETVMYEPCKIAISDRHGGNAGELEEHAQFCDKRGKDATETINKRRRVTAQREEPRAPKPGPTVIIDDDEEPGWMPVDDDELPFDDDEITGIEAM